jgi:phosphoribosyl 1,2-cyclic phosphate phosphodiesterase
MKLTVLGSGGFCATPRPGCSCAVCEEARRVGGRAARLGPSLYLHDIAALFDTPEDVAAELVRAGVDKVSHVFYTHWHPDHTMGMRIVEQLNVKWADDGSWRMPAKSKTVVHMPRQVKEEIFARFGFLFEFWERRGLVEVKAIDSPVKIGAFTISAIVRKSRHMTTTHSAIYIISDGKSKVAYAPCDITPFPMDEPLLEGCSAMILQIGWVGEEMARRAKKGPHYEISMDEISDIMKRYKPKRTILTHIGDELGLTQGKLGAIVWERGVDIAYDGMEIET